MDWGLLQIAGALFVVCIAIFFWWIRHSEKKIAKEDQMNWFSFLIGIFIGIGIGRFYKVFKKFGEFLDKENMEKK